MAAICVECKKSVERSFGVTNPLIIHKMLAGLLGVVYGNDMSWCGHIPSMVHYCKHFTL